MKPKCLYHASQNPNIDVFEPRAESIRDPDEGPVVFATPDKAYAAMFVVPSDDSWTSKSRNNGEYTCVIGDMERYKALDKGGAIYELDSETFETDPRKGMGKKEWTSKKAAVPIKKDVYSSGLRAMIELGVKVYTMEPDEFERFNQLKKEKRYEEAFGMLGKSGKVKPWLGLDPSKNEMKPNESAERFEHEFFSGPWEKMAGIAAPEILSLETADEKTGYLWDGMKPALDAYIEQNKISVTSDGLANREYFESVAHHMYELNQRTPGCWKDCWPQTALEVHRTNCALGSLVAAEAFIKSGIPEDEIEYGFPGPMSHANIFVRGYYIDQANGVVVPTKGEKVVDGIKCYELDLEGESMEVQEKVPFRLIPAAPLHKGVAPLIWNLDPMVTDTKREKESQELSARFEVSRKEARVFSKYGRKVLMPPEWDPRRMNAQPEWEKERLESSERINTTS